MLPVNKFVSESCMAIVADIGGTNARFSRVDLAGMRFDRTAVYACADFANLEEIMRFYQTEHGLTDIRQAAIALACPVTTDQVALTNLPWCFSIQELQRSFGFHRLSVLNDFAAIALSLPLLTERETMQLGGEKPIKQQPMAVLGAGTGLGVAGLLPVDDGFKVAVSEAGHSDWSAQNEQEWFIQRYLTQEYGHVSVERLLSGPGLEKIDLALAAYQGRTQRQRSASKITHLALTQRCPLAMDTVEQFCASLGSFAGDLALMFMALGGVYLAGGIVPRLWPLVRRSAFRARFEAKGRFAPLQQKLPVYAVIAAQPGLLGAAASLRQTLAVTT